MPLCTKQGKKKFLQRNCYNQAISCADFCLVNLGSCFHAYDGLYSEKSSNQGAGSVLRSDDVVARGK